MKPSSDRAELLDLVARWTRAVRVGDIAGVLAAHGDDMVMFDAPGPLSCRGLRSYRKAWKFFFSFQPKGKFSLSSLQLAVDGSVAFCHGLLTIGGKKTFRGRLTMGFRKRRGKWLIVHEHHSCPPD